MSDDRFLTESFLSNIDYSHIEREPVNLNAIDLSPIERVQPDPSDPGGIPLNHDNNVDIDKYHSTPQPAQNNIEPIARRTSERQNSSRGSHRTIPNSSHSESKKDINLDENIPKKHRFHSVLRFLWWWEVLAALLGLISTVLIVAILASMDGKPLSKWRTSAIQPNSLVAIFSTIARSSLLVPLAECLGQLKWSYFEKKKRLDHFQSFDSASRGPWGACRFLWKIKGKAILGTIGAIATILMLAFEPFAQQVIQYRSRQSQLQNSNGSIGVAHAWTDVAVQNASSKWWTSAGEKLYEPIVMGITSALLNQPFDTITNGHCPTTDCRLPDSTSLAVCSHCDTYQVTGSDFDDCIYELVEVPIVEPSTEEEVNFEGEVFVDESLPIEEPQSETFVKRQGGRTFTDRTKFIRFAKQRLLNTSIEAQVQVNCTKRIDNSSTLTILTYAQLGKSHGSIYTDSSPLLAYGTGASDISGDEEVYDPEGFRFCIYDAWNNARLSLLQSRAYHETDPQAFMQLTKATCFTSSSDLTLFRNLENTGEINGTISHCQLNLCAQRYTKLAVNNGRTSTDSTEHIPLVVDERQSPLHDDPNYVYTAKGILDQQFTIGNQSRGSLVHMFHSIAVRTEQGVYDFNHQVRPKDWPELFTRFASALTTILRSPLNPHAENVSTEAYGPETYVHVRWWWMTMPLTLATLSVLFLVLTIFESRKKAYLFKTSVLAVLSRAGGEWNEATPTALDSEDGKVTYRALEKQAKTIRAVFANDDQGRLRLEKE